MPELMTKQDAIEYLLYMKHDVQAKSPMDIALDTAIEALKHPTIEPEVRHGRWIAHDVINEQPAVNRWIPCSERLPEVDTNVLIYYPKWKDAPIQTAHIMSDGLCWEFSDGEFYPSKSEVTHWMPLPEPPKE